MELYQIQQFLAVARLENISKAAEEIHTSQPALSRTMKMLEEELEVPLFTRTKNTITLNEYGRVAEKHARRVCEEAERLKSSVQDLYKKLHSMTIASVAPAPLWILPQAVKAVFPQISVSTELKGSSEISAGLEDGSVQIGVVAEEVSDKKFFCKKCAEERLNFSVPKGHPMARRKSVSFKDIDGLTMLLMSDIGFWHEIHRQKMPPQPIFAAKRAERLFHACKRKLSAVFFKQPHDEPSRISKRPRTYSHKRQGSPCRLLCRMQEN